MSALTFPYNLRSPLNSYLTRQSSSLTPTAKPHVTLTYAASLDSSISLSPGTQTHLSGHLSKAMTHYLRSRHSAILIGVGTAAVDDPGLNCRLDDVVALEGLEGMD